MSRGIEGGIEGEIEGGIERDRKWDRKGGIQTKLFQHFAPNNFFNNSLNVIFNPFTNVSKSNKTKRGE